MRFHRCFDVERKKAPFLPDEFSQKDLFVRVERLLVFGKREREREKVTRQRVVVKAQSKEEEEEEEEKKNARDDDDDSKETLKTHVDDQR